MKTERRVILHINTARKYGRGLLTGIGRYARLRGTWQFYRSLPRYVTAVNRREEMMRVHDWRPTGGIVWDSERIGELLSLGIPLVVSPNVVVSKHYRDLFEAFPQIGSNCEAIGKMGAEYFLDRGFRHFGFCGFRRAPWAQRRASAFAQRIAEAGYDTDVFPLRGAPKAKRLQEATDHIVEWIRSLPKPLAVMACNDDRAFNVVDACRRAGCLIPEEVAVLGVDDEEEACEVFTPPLSSICLNATMAGFRAAEVLEAMMTGKTVPQTKWKIPVEPMYVVTRRSTDVMAIEDRVVAEAVNYVEQQVYAPIQVEDVVRKVSLSRRNLELRFRKALGRSVYAHIRKTKVNRITEVLLSTQTSIQEIAKAFGYPDAHNMSRFFKKETGLSLSEYRRKHRF